MPPYVISIYGFWVWLRTSIKRTSHYSDNLGITGKIFKAENHLKDNLVRVMSFYRKYAISLELSSPFSNKVENLS